MNLNAVAALANDHDWQARDELEAAGGTVTRSVEEHRLIAEVARAYLSACQRDDIQRDKFAGLAMQGLLAGMSSDPTTLISGPQIATTAYDIALCMMDARDGRGQR